MHVRHAKNAIALPLHRFGFLVAGLPESIGPAMLGAIGAVGKASYFLPGSYVRRFDKHEAKVLAAAASRVPAK